MIRIGEFTLRVEWLRCFALLCFIVLGFVWGIKGQNFSPGSINTTNSSLGYWLRPENSNQPLDNLQVDTLRSNVFPAQTGREGISGPRANGVTTQLSELNYNTSVETDDSWFGFHRNLGASPTG